MRPGSQLARSLTAECSKMALLITHSKDDVKLGLFKKSFPYLGCQNLWYRYILQKGARGETSESDTFARPWFTLKCWSQNRTKGLRTGQKTAKLDGLIVKPWFPFKSGSQKWTQNLHLHYKNGSQNQTTKCLSDQINTTLHCPLLWSSSSEVSLLVQNVTRCFNLPNLFNIKQVT